MREPPREFDRQAMKRWLPVTDGHGPFLGNVADGQVNHFVDRIIRGKNAMIARHLAQGHIDGRGGISRVNHGCRMSSGKANNGITRVQCALHDLLILG